MKKTLKVSKDINLIKIVATPKHIKVLYDLLKYREKRIAISHNQIPSFKKHKFFVSSKPYRFWFLIEKKNIFLGAVYISKYNTIGIHFFKTNQSLLKEILLFLFKSFTPLKEIPSVRTANFVINLSCKNKKYADIIKKIGGTKIQETYIFNINS